MVRMDLEGWHYVLLTEIHGDQVYLFDPYYRDEPFEQDWIQMVWNRPESCNRILSTARLERETIEPYAFGPIEHREAVLLFNERTRLTPERTVEYII